MDMAQGQYSEQIEALLEGRSEVTAKDFFAAMPGIPAQTVYSRIRSLERAGRIYAGGHGVYRVGSKMKYKVLPTPWMIEVNEYLIRECVGVGHCVSERNGNLYVEVSRIHVQRVLEALKAGNMKAADSKSAARIDGLTGYVIVGQMVSEAPCLDDEYVPVPSLEKSLVDSIAEGKCSYEEVQKQFQRAFEVYEINTSTLLRYASRRGVRSRASAHIASLNHERIEMIGKIQKFFETQPVERAWLFGSFSRQEERPDSDIDLLVDFVPESDVSLMDHVRMSYGLQDCLRREVDLVTNGTLLPFAITTANNDKYQIYERTYQRPGTA